MNIEKFKIPSRRFSTRDGDIYRIDKTMARKIYDDSGDAVYPYRREDILICACKMHPDNMWQPATRLINPETFDGDSFDSYVNSHEYYNCDSERGKYSHFYVYEKF